MKLAMLLDRRSAGRVPLDPHVFGFPVEDALVGYGLGAVDEARRNLPYLVAGS